MTIMSFWRTKLAVLPTTDNLDLWAIILLSPRAQVTPSASAGRCRRLHQSKEQVVVYGTNGDEEVGSMLMEGKASGFTKLVRDMVIYKT